MNARPEKAFVFAAGLGTRMRPLTLTLPKPLVRVGGKTMLDHMLDRLDESGVDDVIVNVHWLADQVEETAKLRCRPSIEISDERSLLLDQAGGIIKVLDRFEGKPFFICNTDALWVDAPAPQVARLRDHWDAGKMDVLLLLANRAESLGAEGRGDFFIDATGALSRPGPNEEAPFTYAGVGVIKSSLFEGRDVAPLKLAPFFFEAAARGRLYGLVLQGRWLHVGTIGMIEQAEAAFSSRLDAHGSTASADAPDSRDPTCGPVYST
ncbi:MurNAc alpha-1-phosphate uridylyltransferase [Rhodoblastus acidophilus]|uniref:nucleotidyltransferase family protein n=1 Tax=Rhodoblastus acidophilus TaxID=1074 RepID=UPI0022257676|nr:nucleotidyltransferase family protein [Rhodoblastus acidophilus]MCW2315096.1 MurNAc alpha-1-phosphate uridylyltransferase [Rhodoblastus acidophilus]